MTEYQKIAIGRARRIVRDLQFTLTALGSGSRIVALADNSQVVRDLSARAKQLYGAD
jgi:hypothetical protein